MTEITKEQAEILDKFIEFCTNAAKSDASDECDAQNPSCHDPAETASVSSEAPKVTRDPSVDVSMSAYDLLPADERDAIAWVREHGGLDAVRKMAAITLDVYQRLVDESAGPEMLETDAGTIGSMMAEIAEAIVKRSKERTRALDLLDESVPRVAYERHIIKRQRQIDESHAALRRRNARVAELESERDKLRETACGLYRQIAEMTARLMPEGMEWPRFEDGSPVGIGDDVVGPDYGERIHVDEVFFHANGFTLREKGRSGKWYESDDRFKRPDKVLDADGVETEVGDDLYSVEGSLKFHVSHVDRINGKIATDAMFSLDKWADPAMYTHRAPVLAADGKPLREGDTVYMLDDDRPYTLKRFDGDHVYINAGGSSFDFWTFPRKLTHERPVADTWERLEEDAALPYTEYCEANDLCAVYMGRDAQERAKASDLVRRAKAIAERDA